MNSNRKMYNFLCGLVRNFSRKMETQWEVPFDGQPAVFCPNHAGAFGPINMCAKFPLRDNCNPWLNADMMDPKKVPAYVRQDYWWTPGSFWEPLLTRTLPYMAAAVLPPILRCAPGVPVYHDMRVIQTFRQSIGHLKEGRHLVIFPEQPDGFQSHSPKLNSGFLQIAPMAYRTLGLQLQFYPVYIDTKKSRFTVCAPAQYQPEIPLAEQTESILEVLRRGIQRA